MRIKIFLAVALAAAGCAKQAATPAATTTQPVAINAAAGGQPAVHVKGIRVTPESVRLGQPATVSLQLDTPDPKAMVRVNWFGPDGWSVFESKAPASQAQITLTVPAKTFRDSGKYRAEVRTGNVYQGEATLDVSG